MLNNNRKRIEIPFQNVYMPEYWKSLKWVGEDGIVSIVNDGFDSLSSLDEIPSDPPIEIATKLLTIHIECNADIIQIDEIKSKDTRDFYFINIGNIEILSEIRNKRVVNTMQFEQETFYEKFRCFLCEYKTIELEIELKDRVKIAKGMRVKFVLVETPKNIKFFRYNDKRTFIKNRNRYKRYQTIVLKFDYKCLDVKYIVKCTNSKR